MKNKGQNYLKKLERELSKAVRRKEQSESIIFELSWQVFKDSGIKQNGEVVKMLTKTIEIGKKNEKFIRRVEEKLKQAKKE